MYKRHDVEIRTLFLSVVTDRKIDATKINFNDNPPLEYKLEGIGRKRSPTYGESFNIRPRKFVFSTFIAYQYIFRVV